MTARILAAVVSYLEDPRRYLEFPNDGKDEAMQRVRVRKQIRRGGRLVVGAVVVGTLFGACDMGRDDRRPETPTPAPSVAPVVLPDCAEDEYLLIGRGDFDGRRWESYECLHPEDVAPMAAADDGFGRALAEGLCEDWRRWYIERSACEDF